MPLDGKRILIADNDHLIALDIAREIQQAGAAVIRAASYADALAAIDEADIDGATVELALMGWGFKYMAVADALAARKVPFIFVTSRLLPDTVPSGHADVPRIEKPFAPGVVLRALEGVLNGA